MTAKELFGAHDAVLEYRPVWHAGAVMWYWVLLPLPSEHQALASGEATSKGMASTQGRQAAHKLSWRVAKVRTFGINAPFSEAR